MTIKEKIDQGKTFLGIEFGSTRIKAVLIDETMQPIAGGSSEWENRHENGYWTYSLDDIHSGLQSCYASLADNVRERYGTEITTLGAIGISGMMHGYMPFDKDGRLLAPFRTWRNTTTERAAAELTQLFGFNIPQRWSIAHLYQAALNGEEHTREIAYINTLAGYIHHRLTGVRALGIGEASGMFPIENGGYNEAMLDKFDALIKEYNYDWDIRSVLPRVLSSGENAGCLTEEGARLIDPSGRLSAGIPMCPPEGDAGTGMTATNSVKPGTGNVSAGTSIFSMLVLDKPLGGVYPEIDVVTTPEGAPVAMVHCNNCCSEIDAWVRLFGEFAELTGNPINKSELYSLLYKNSLNGDADCGGVTAYNFISGEPVAGAENGRPLYFRDPDGQFGLANFIRAELYSTMASLKIGMDILFEKENVRAENFSAHGGLFKVSGVAQQYLADALDTPATVTKTAGEGGAWGMALLAAYMVLGSERSLTEFLDDEVFAQMESETLLPTKDGKEGFDRFMQSYKAGLAAAKAAADI